MSNTHSQDHSAKPHSQSHSLPAHSHYFKDVSQLDTIDVYRVLELFNVVNPCIQHAVKKLLVAGGRGAGKDINKDIQEAIDSLERWKALRQEDNPIFNRRSSDKIAEVEFPEVENDSEEPKEIKNTGKFKVGDKVKITARPDGVPVEYVDTHGVVAELFNSGQADEHYRVTTFDGDYWFYDSTEIEHV